MSTKFKKRQLPDVTVYTDAVNTFTEKVLIPEIIPTQDAEAINLGFFNEKKEEIDNEIILLKNPDRIVVDAGFTLSGQILTMNALWQWVIDNTSYSNPTSLNLTIPLSSATKTRADIIVLTKSNNFVRVEGVESSTNPPIPNIPNDTLLALTVIVNDSAFVDIGNVITGDAFVKKSERANVLLTGSGVIDNLSLTDEKATIVFKGSITELRTMSYSSVPYNGKRITLFNAQNTPVLIKNAYSGLGVDFVFPDNLDYTLKPKETIEFSFDTTYLPYAHHMFIGMDFEKSKDNVFLDPSNKNFKNITLNTYGVAISASGSQGSTVGLGMDIIYDPKRNLYIMFYSSWNGSGVVETTGGQDIWTATSVDLKTWTKISDTVPTIPRGSSGSYDFAGGTFPQLFYDTDTELWNMYYIAFNTIGFEKGVSKIARATASDLLGTWTKTGVVFQSPSGWLQSGNHIYRPCVIKFDNLYYMFFNGGVYGDERFGYAVSETLSGPFTASTNPIIPAGTKAAPWCSDDFFSDPQVFFEEGKWYCAFWARFSGFARIGLLWTTNEDFPLNWRAYDNYIELGSGNQQRPVFLKKDGFTYLIYNTGVLGSLNINMASSLPSTTTSVALVPQFVQQYGPNLLEGYGYYSRVIGSTALSTIAGCDSQYFLADFPGVTNWNQLSARLFFGLRSRGFTGNYEVNIGGVSVKSGSLVINYNEINDTIIFPSSTASSIKLIFRASNTNASGEVWMLFYQIKVFKP